MELATVLPNGCEEHATTTKIIGTRSFPALADARIFEEFGLRMSGYLNSGMTRSANKRIFFSAISCGIPPKWNVPEMVVSPTSSRHF